MAAAAGIGALPRPDSLEKTPRATPMRMVSITAEPAKPPLAAVGVWRLPRVAGRPVAAVLIYILLAHLVFAVRYDIPDAFMFFVPAYLLLAREPVALLRAVGVENASAWHLLNFLCFLLGVYFVYRLAERLVPPWPAAAGAGRENHAWRTRRCAAGVDCERSHEACQPCYSRARSGWNAGDPSPPESWHG